MEDVLTKARELAGLIENSDAAREYSQAVKELDGDLAVKDKLAQYRKLAEQSASAHTNGELPIEEQKKLSRLYYDLTMDSRLKRLLNSETALAAMITEVERIISESVEGFVV